MKTICSLGLVALVLVACRVNDDYANASMIAEVNSLSLTANDTIRVNRGITNTGDEELWLNATIPAFEITNAQGQAACIDGTLDLQNPELIRIAPLSGITDERFYAISDLTNCAPGTYTMYLRATLRRTETGEDKYSLRSQPSNFEITAAP